MSSIGQNPELGALVPRNIPLKGGDHYIAPVNIKNDAEESNQLYNDHSHHQHSATAKIMFYNASAGNYLLVRMMYLIYFWEKNVLEPGASRIDLKQMATANFTTKPPMLMM
jgi:hypothetical protein